MQRRDFFDERLTYSVIGVVVHYKDLELGGQRLDMIVDDVLVVETKSTFQLSRVASRQTYNYLPHFFRIECHRRRRPRKHNQFSPKDQPSYPEGEESSYPEDESI